MTTVLPAPVAPVHLHAVTDPPSSSSGYLHVEPWRDPVIDEIGHDPRSAYVEMFWLPVLGPSTTWLLRRFASHLDDAPAGVDLPIDDLARRLGIGEKSGPNAPFARTIKRCVDFQMAEWHDDASLLVRTHLPPLARRHIRRLPESLQAEHDALVGSAPPGTSSERLRSHGRRLALSLLDFGDDQSSAESQLVRWGFEPSLAADCAAFASLEHARRQAARIMHPTGAHPVLPARAGRPAGTAVGRPAARLAAPPPAQPATQA